MGKYNRLLRAARDVMGAGALLALAASPSFAQSASTAPGYVPTMADWMAVNDVMYRYRLGVEKGDQKALLSAFWEDGANIAVPSPGMEFKMPLDGSMPTPPGGPGGPGGPPPGFTGPPPGGAGGPPPGFTGPPPGFTGPPPGGPPGSAGGEGNVWHMPFSDTFRFESPTRATHYQYFLSIYPQPEKTGENLQPRDKRLTTVGWPGHYEDILEKRHGEWRILQRKSYINAK